MTKNLIIIGLIIIILLVLAIIFTYLFMKILLPACEWFGKFISKNLKSIYWLYIIEISFLITLGVFMYANFRLISFSGSTSYLHFVYFVVFAALIIIESSVYHEFRIKNAVSITGGIIGWIKSKTIWKSYIGNRTILFIEHIAHLFYLMVPFYVSLVFISILKWETQFYFIVLILLPIYANIWVYLKIIWKKYYFLIGFGVYEAIFMRRLIVYSFIILYGFFEVYGRFNQFLNGYNNFDFNYLFVSSAVLLYIAIDRLCKELVSDVDRFKQRKQ